MSAPFTPGPWRYENRQTHCAIYHSREPQDGYANRVAETMQWSPAAAGRVTPAECEANARLIAAAPELLEALEMASNALTVCVESGGFYVGEGIFEKVHAAIAKARGEAA